MTEAKKSSEAAGEHVEVVDRRRFTSEGTLRPDVAAQQVEEKPHAAATPPRRDTIPESRPAEKAHESRRPRHGPQVDFRALVLSLSTSAMYQLGLLAEPGMPPPPPDFEAARQTIDMLAVLEEKTRNNLTPEEKRLLEQVLDELRIYYASQGRK